MWGNLSPSRKTLHPAESKRCFRKLRKCEHNNVTAISHTFKWQHSGQLAETIAPKSNHVDIKNFNFFKGKVIQKGKFCHLLILMFFQTCMVVFLLWNTKKMYILKNVNAVFVHTIKVNGAQNNIDWTPLMFIVWTKQKPRHIPTKTDAQHSHRQDI